MQNPQEKPEDSDERLRPDLNRGWRICNPQETNEKPGNAHRVQHLVQHQELAALENIEFFDHRLSRLVILFASATADQQNAILLQAESLFANAPKSRKKRSDAEPARILDQDT